MTIRVFNEDNMGYYHYSLHDGTVGIVYCDYIYENLNFDWATKYWDYLKDGGVLIAQTDFHSNHRLRTFIEDNLPHSVFVNELVWKNEWGNHPKNRFHQCYDSIIIYSNGLNWKFDSSLVQVPKVTMTKGLNPSGRTTKTATAWIDDITLTTTAKERVKKEDGHLVRWQKPLRLYDRVILPFYTNGDFIIDPFMGSGSLGKWCKAKDINYIGIECDTEVFKLAVKNIQGE